MALFALSRLLCTNFFVILLVCCNIIIVDKCDGAVSGCPILSTCADYDWCTAVQCKANGKFDYGCYDTSSVPEIVRLQQNQDWCYAIAEAKDVCRRIPKHERQIVCYSCNTDYCDAATCKEAFCGGYPSTKNGISYTTQNPSTESSSVMDNTSTTTTTTTTKRSTTDDGDPGDANTTSTNLSTIKKESDASSVPISSTPTTTTTLGKSSKSSKAIRWTFPPGDSLPLFQFDFIRGSEEDRAIAEKTMEEDA